ncbi:MAG TPA: ribbon-helix-helix domain-containing protein [Candidatus Nanoarchaeia archaeon]|nr:ribbon-helix-helix domain-containing protein [Candidatus Nanoarchaeia archaeon]
MKSKISVSVEEEIISQIKKLLEDGAFRNTSHVVEYSVKKFLKEHKDV